MYEVVTQTGGAPVWEPHPCWYAISGAEALSNATQAQVVQRVVRIATHRGHSEGKHREDDDAGQNRDDQCHEDAFLGAHVWLPLWGCGVHVGFGEDVVLCRRLRCGRSGLRLVEVPDERVEAGEGGADCRCTSPIFDRHTSESARRST